MQRETEKWITIARSSTRRDHIQQELREIKATATIRDTHLHQEGALVKVRQVANNWIGLKIKKQALRQTKYSVFEKVTIRVCKQPIKRDRDKIMRLE